MEALWHPMKLLQKKPKMYELNFDYRLIDVEGESENLTTVELKIDGYRGVCYQYHRARIIEDAGVAKLQYGYTILDPGEHDIDVLNSDEKFFTIMGDILQQIILKKIEHDEQTGKNDSQEFDLQ